MALRGLDGVNFSLHWGLVWFQGWVYFWDSACEMGVLSCGGHSGGGGESGLLSLAWVSWVGGFAWAGEFPFLFFLGGGGGGGGRGGRGRGKLGFVVL